MGRHRSSQLPAQRQPQQQVLAAEFFRGPLPRPTDFAHYDQVVPGAGERILHQFEEQSAHRRTLEAKVVDSNIAGERRGTYAATYLASLFVIGGFVLVWLGQSTPGIGALAWAAAQVSGTFIVNILGRRDELRRKREQEQQQAPR
jgi:uncharacterized membrane protein